MPTTELVLGDKFKMRGCSARENFACAEGSPSSNFRVMQMFSSRNCCGSRRHGPNQVAVSAGSLTYPHSDSSVSPNPRTSSWVRLHTVTVQLRPYEAKHAPATLAIFVDAVTQTGAADYLPEQIQAWASPGQRNPETWHQEMLARSSFVALVEGTVAGFSDVTSDGFIDMLYVAPKFQRRGIASALLAEAERRARSLGASELSADVSITARPFFAHHHFHITQTQHPVRGGVALKNYRMCKSLG